MSFFIVAWSQAHIFKALGSPLELPGCIDKLHKSDQRMLNHLCDMYNILRAQTIYAKKYYHEMASEATKYEQDVAKATQLLVDLRYDVEESFKCAQQGISAKQTCSSVLYVPKEYREYGNSDDLFRNLVC